MEKKKIKGIEKYLVNFIVKNKLYFGGLEVDHDLKNFIFNLSIKRKSCLFNVYDQIFLIKKFHSLLGHSLRVNQKPILFFGVNKFGLDFKHLSKVDFINQQIFKLCFTVLEENTFNIKIINKRLCDFFWNNYSIEFFKEFHFMENFKLFEKDLFFLLSKSKIRLNGFFFNNWVGGHFSNFHFIKTKFSSFISRKNYNFYNMEKVFFRNIFINLHSIYNIAFGFNRSPGLVIFFSKMGYDAFIKEFKKLGVPVVCIVGEKESLDFVDYPLLGDSLNINTVLFYCYLIEEFLKKKEKRKKNEESK